MACTKTSFVPAIVFLILILLEVGISSGQEFMVEDRKIDCNGKCNYRCSRTSRRKMCIRTCNTCCRRCNCVPPGTSDNTAACPCYANMRTRGGKLKCP